MPRTVPHDACFFHPTRSSQQFGSFNKAWQTLVAGDSDMSCMTLLSWPMRTGFDDLESHSAKCVEDSSPIAAPSD